MSLKSLAKDLISETPAISWLPEKKKQILSNQISNDYTFGRFPDFFEKRVNGEKFPEERMSIIASEIFENNSNFTAPNSLVLFSGKKQFDAEEFIIQNPEYDVIHSRPVGAMLEMLNFFDENLNLTREKRYAPWNRAAYKICWCAFGDVKAIVDKPKPTSTFLTVEMPVILETGSILTINGEDKHQFNKNLQLQLK